MEQGLIGVIVPVYKVEKYIAECIDSILAQTYTKFRLILVDDGTPDNAGKICDEYAKKDPRITIIHQENAGVTRARARGVEEANDCEFITFVDSDDKLSKTALQELHTMMGKGYDIVITDNVLHYPKFETESITTIMFQESLISEKVSSAPWGKLFKRALFTPSIFDIPREIIMGEDLIMNLRLTYCCKSRIGIIHSLIYHYNRHIDNICHNFKDSAEHEFMLYSSMATYMDTCSYSIIKRTLSKWNRMFGYTYTKPAWYGSKIHKRLISDIAKYQYKINLIDNILLKVANPIIRYIAVTAKKIKNKISSILK